MHQLYRDPTRPFTRRLILGSFLLTAVSLLILLGAWLNAFTTTHPRALPPVIPPPITVTVTLPASPDAFPTDAPTPPNTTSPGAFPASPAASSGRAPSRPTRIDGAAQAACTAHAQSIALRKAGRTKEATTQSQAAAEAAQSSTIHALKALKNQPPKSLSTTLDTWCRKHLPTHPTPPPPASPH